MDRDTERQGWRQVLRRGLILVRRVSESLFLQGPGGDRAYLTVLDAEPGQAVLQLDLPRVGPVTLFLDTRARGRVRLQIGAPDSVFILRSECDAAGGPCNDTPSTIAPPGWVDIARSA